MRKVIENHSSTPMYNSPTATAIEDTHRDLFFTKKDARDEDDSKWFDPENFPSSWKKQMYEVKKKESSNPFYFDEEMFIETQQQQHHQQQRQRPHAKYVQEHSPDLDIDRTKGKSTHNDNDDEFSTYSFHENAKSKDNDDDSCIHLEGTEIEPSVSLLTKIKKGKLGRFVKRFKNGDKRKEKKQRRLFSRNKKKKEKSETITESQDQEEVKDGYDAEPDPTGLFYRKLGDNEEDVPKPQNRNFSAERNNSFGECSSMPFDEI